MTRIAILFLFSLACLAVSNAQSGSLNLPSFAAAPSPLPELSPGTLAALPKVPLPPPSLSPLPPPPTSLGGENVTLYALNATCVTSTSPIGQPVETTITGGGSFSGKGLFVGEGTFESSPAETNPVFTGIYGTWSGNATGGCIGGATFTTEDPDASLAGEGNLEGTGQFHLPQGLFVGTGTYEGSDLYFNGVNGTVSFAASQGRLYGNGTVSGTAFLCTGPGIYQGQGSYSGEGTFTGSGYYYGSDGDFIGTAEVDGSAECNGTAVTDADLGGSDVLGITGYLNEISEQSANISTATMYAQDYALEPYRAPAPAPAALPTHAAG